MRVNPCPSCGFHNISFNDSHDWFEIESNTCGAMIIRDNEEDAIEAWNAPDVDGSTSDGCHTFDELYAHRAQLFIALINAYPEKSWWSKTHSDGAVWEGYVIAGIDLPTGEISYHLSDEDAKFLPRSAEIEVGKEWDGYTSDDVLHRLQNFNLTKR